MCACSCSLTRVHFLSDQNLQDMHSGLKMAPPCRLNFFSKKNVGYSLCEASLNCIFFGFFNPLCKKTVQLPFSSTASKGAVGLFSLLPLVVVITGVLSWSSSSVSEAAKALNAFGTDELKNKQAEIIAILFYIFCFQS